MSTRPGGQPFGGSSRRAGGRSLGAMPHAAITLPLIAAIAAARCADVALTVRLLVRARRTRRARD